MHCLPVYIQAIMIKEGVTLAQLALMVSHGTMAYGVEADMHMLLGDRQDVVSACLEDGMSQDELAEKINAILDTRTQDTEVIVLADIIGGSPLTCALTCLSEHGLLAHARALGGLSLPMVIALTTQGFDDNLSGDALVCATLQATHDATIEFKIPQDNSCDEEDEDI